ncbi:membrane protein [Streptomyces spiroverticillatus]|uniref:Membrane protein n=1 Tax=Streptomyces finlayi TaxID=67296 RepID=A0A919C8I6_9ACTN|nr:membrane protein [Streptomyces spiroverticillatus]GHC82706.1 membrane protein [Streptomyces finlayi]
MFAGVRLTGMLLMAVWAWHIGKSPLKLLGQSWDSLWYTRIATHGYGHTQVFAGGEVVQSDLAFFPLYPGLIRAVCTVLPVTPGGAGLLISWTAALAAAWGIFAVVDRLYGRRVATVTVALWGLLPHSVVLSMAYTEPVLVALSAWSLYSVLTRRWLLAGALAAVAGLSRPNAVALVAAVVLTAAYELLKGRQRGWRVWTGALLAPLGWASYVLHVGIRTGDPLGGYFAVQAGWSSRFDFGSGTLKFIRHLVSAPERFSFPMALVIVAVGVLLLALMAYGMDRRPPLALLVYTGVLVLITVGGAGFFESKPRFLLPAFPLLLPLACAMTKARPRAAVVVTAALAGLSMAYGTYLLTVAPMPM